jgi:hypothetical protein
MYGRLLELLRDALQAGQHDDHVEAEVLPRDDHEHRDHDQRRVAQPVLDECLQAGVRERRIETESGLEQQREDDAGHASDRTYGRKNSTRNIARPGKRRLSSTASAS